jgi:hypothetical protein
MTSPIQALIEDRIRALGLKRRDLVLRAGYNNVAKGHRRLSELIGGDLDHHTGGLISRLPAALDVPAEVVNEAITATRQQQWEAADAAWRAAFKPHAIIITEHTRPTSITLAAFTGADRQLRVDFEPDTAVITYISQTLKAARQRSPIPYFGQAVGVVVNYSPDYAVRFDLQGEPLEILPRAYEPGMLTVSIRGRPVPPGALAAILGIR